MASCASWARTRDGAGDGDGLGPLGNGTELAGGDGAPLTNCPAGGCGDVLGLGGATGAGADKTCLNGLGWGGHGSSGTAGAGEGVTATDAAGRGCRLGTGAGWGLLGGRLSAVKSWGGIQRGPGTGVPAGGGKSCMGIALVGAEAEPGLAPGE
jgi:hypothetical protein